MSDSATRKSSIQVIDRSAMLLDAIAGYDEPASLKILSADTGLHPSTAFRILGALTNVGLVEKDVQGRYLLGRKLATLAQKVQRGGDIRHEALPIMEVLRDRVGETVNSDRATTLHLARRVQQNECLLCYSRYLSIRLWS